MLAFAAFGLVASGGYVVNDIADREADRHNPHKRHRPVASGQVPVAAAAGLAPLLMLGGLALGWAVTPSLAAMLLAYLAVTTLYSWRLKRWALADVVVLAALYTLRIIAGGVATGIPLSAWLLAFSVFVFFSLALAKRYAELVELREAGDDAALRRDYEVGDLPLLEAMGVVSGYLSLLVLALYITSDDVVALYATPHWLWAALPALLYWISRLWLLAHRGRLHGDPFVFAIRDPLSYAVGAVILLSLAVAM